MKKSLRVIPLTAAFMLAAAGIGSAASTPETVYYQNAQKQWVKSENYLADKEEIQKAQLRGHEIYVVDVDGAVVNWAKAINNNQSYSDAQHDSSINVEDLERKVSGSEPVDPEEPGDQAGSVVVKVSGENVSVVSGDLDVVASGKIQTILPGDNQVLVILKDGHSTDHYVAKYNGQEMTPRTDKKGFYIGVGPAKEAEITISKKSDQSVEIDVVDVAASKIQTILPGDNQVLVMLKEGHSTDDYTAEYNGQAMKPRTDKRGFYIGIGPATDAEVTIVGANGSQTVTIPQ